MSDQEIDFQGLYRRLDRAQQALARGVEPGSEEERSILAARAAAVAARRDPPPAGEEVLCFRVGGGAYALPIQQVRAVVPLRDLCPLPGAPSHLLGLLVSRARISVVLDLRALLKLEGGGMSDLTQVIIASLGDELFGIAAEVVEGSASLRRSPGAPWPGPFAWVSDDQRAVLELSRLVDDSAAGGGA